MGAAANVRSFVRSFVAVLAASSIISCGTPEMAEVAEEELRESPATFDIVLDPAGTDPAGTIDVDNPEQWARDASVDVDRRCTGTLVTPRLVVTSAHCVSGATSASKVSFRPLSPHTSGFGCPATPAGLMLCPCLTGFRQYTSNTCLPATACPTAPVACAAGVAPLATMVATGPDAPSPPATAQVPANVPEVYDVQTIGCVTDHGSGYLCAGEGNLSVLNEEYDIAVLVLAERVDIGVLGLRDSGYPVIPAHVLTANPGDHVTAWWGATLAHVGFGQRINCRPSDDIFCTATWSPLRDLAAQIQSINDTDGTSTLLGPVGAPGDSGGGVFTNYDGDHPGVPHQLLGVFNVSLGDDRYVRVTSGTVQGWLETVLGTRQYAFRGYRA